MLTEQEIMNNAFKEMIFLEDMTAHKYSEMAKQITNPQIQNMLNGMEMATRNNYNILNQKMSDMGMI